MGKKFNVLSIIGNWNFRQSTRVYHGGPAFWKFDPTTSRVSTCNT